MTGMDCSAAMLAYAKRKFNRRGLKGRFLKRDMRRFRLNMIFDNVICMGDSFSYMAGEDDQVSYLRFVASMLKEGSLYLVETETPAYWLDKDETIQRDNWKCKRGDTVISVRREWYDVNRKKMVGKEKITLRIKEREEEITHESFHESSIVLPSKFNDLILAEGSFRLLCWYKGMGRSSDDNVQREPQGTLFVLQKEEWT